MPEFRMPLALIIKISECLCYLPEKVTIFLNPHDFCPQNGRILRNKLLTNFFHEFLGVHAPPRLLLLC